MVSRFSAGPHNKIVTNGRLYIYIYIYIKQSIVYVLCIYNRTLFLYVWASACVYLCVYVARCRKGLRKGCGYGILVCVVKTAHVLPQCRINLEKIKKRGKSIKEKQKVRKKEIKHSKAYINTYTYGGLSVQLSSFYFTPNAIYECARRT